MIAPVSGERLVDESIGRRSLCGDGGSSAVEDVAFAPRHRATLSSGGVVGGTAMTLGSLPAALGDAAVDDDVLGLRPDYGVLLFVAEGLYGGPTDVASDAALAAAGPVQSTIPRIDPFTYARDVSKREVAERLKEVPLFRDCSSRQLRRIAGRGWERDYPAGSALCEEGRLGDDFFIILQGQAEVTRKRKKVRSLGPGEHFGEIALLKLIGRAPRSATVTARTPVRCFLLPKGAFRDVIYEANIATNLLYGLAAYMRDPF